MRVAILSDLHAHNFEQFSSTLPNGRSSRFQAILDTIAEAEEFCREHKVECFFFLGDMFHSRTKIDVSVYSDTWRAWRRLSDAVGRLYIMVGNHDQYDRAGKIHSLSAFGEFARVVERPILEEHGGMRFAMHPFTTDIARWKQFAALLPELDYFFFHQGVCEATVGAFDITIKAEIRTEDLPLDRAKFCIGGHYHKHQWWAKDRAAFVGSPLQHNFGERDEPKGLLYTPDHTTRPLLVPLLSAPTFQMYDVRDREELEVLKVENSYVRVRCPKKLFDLVRTAHPEWQVEVIVQAEPAPLIPVSDTSDTDLIRAYVARIEQDPDVAKRLTDVGIELLSA